MRNIIKKKLEIVTKLILAVAIFVTSFGYVPLVSADEYTKGDIIDPNKTKTEDGVTLEKTINATDEEGVYTVTLSVSGEEKTQSQTAPIYAVVVFDRSGSMENYYCDLGSAIFNGCSWGDYVKKWDNAVSGAQDFADSLLTAYPNSQIALVTFSDSATSFPFANSNLDNANFGEPNGGTALSNGIKAANTLLATAPKASNKYIIIISDGAPNYGDKYVSAAEDSIKSGYEIFAIGYEDEGTALKKIVSEPSSTHYSDGNAFNISDVFSDMVGNIKIPAGKDATITDVIADGFTYVEGSASTEATVDGQNISFNIGNITEVGTTVSFKIKVDKNLEDGLHRTNDSAKVEYNENAKVEITDSSKIYWEQDKYTYTVNYKEQGTNKVLAEEKVVSDAVYGRTYSESAKDITGYNVVGKSTRTISISEDNQEITFYYTKKNDLSYTVEYYLDENKISNDLDNTFGGKTFEEVINSEDIDINKYLKKGYKDGVITTSMPYTIIDGQNIIQVLYEKREDMTYTVEYLDNDTKESILDSEIRTGKKYLETYTETAKEAPFGYKLVSEATTEVLVNEDNRTVIFYYEKREDMTYTVEYLDNDTKESILDSEIRTGKKYLETYTEEAIEITGYNVVGESTRTISISEDNQEITFYYTKKNDLSYTVEYYLDGNKISNDLDNTFGGKTFEEVINSEDIDINKYLKKGYKDGVITTSMPYTIIDGQNIIQISYTKKDDLTYRVEYYYDGIIDESKTEHFENLTYGTEISEYEDKNIEGYVFVKDTGVLVIDDDTDNVIKVYYEQEETGIGSGYEEDIQPPKTGVETNSPLYLLFLLPAALIVSFRRSTKLEK